MAGTVHIKHIKLSGKKYFRAETNTVVKQQLDKQKKKILILLFQD